MHQASHSFCSMVIGLFIASILTPMASAEDWPQLLGPRRDGTAKVAAPLRVWGKGGPTKVWQIRVGEGFSSPVVSNNQVVVFHRQRGNEVVTCTDAKTGRMLWVHSYACNYQDGYGKGDGPRATPTIHKGQIYTLGAAGHLTCLRLEDGKPMWKKSILKDYVVRKSFFGVGTSPVVADGKLLLNVGGKKAGIVALDLLSGRELWKATDDGASYSSPVATKINGKLRAVFHTRQGVVVLDPKNGKVLHQQEWKARYAASVNVAVPLNIGDGRLFFSSSYETGGLLLQAKSNGKFATLWKGDEKMSNHYNTCVFHKGYLYGIHGRQETGAHLRCIEAATGKVMWTQKRFGCASIVLVGEKAVALTERGALVMFQPNAKAYRELARADVFNDTPCRAHFAVADGRLIGRDNSTVVCWDLTR